MSGKKVTRLVSSLRSRVGGHPRRSRGSGSSAASPRCSRRHLTRRQPDCIAGLVHPRIGTARPSCPDRRSVSSPAWPGLFFGVVRVWTRPNGLGVVDVARHGLRQHDHQCAQVDGDENSMIIRVSSQTARQGSVEYCGSTRRAAGQCEPACVEEGMTPLQHPRDEPQCQRRVRDQR